MKQSDIKKMSVKKLQEQAVSLKKELFALKLSAASTHIKDNSQFKKLRVRIASVLTHLKQKEQDKVDTNDQ